MNKSYKYRLKPTNAQVEYFEKSFGCSRYIYNWALAIRIEAYQKDGTRLSYPDLCKMLTSLKKEEDKRWLAEVGNDSLQQSIRCLDSAFTRFFREKRSFPQFKTKKKSRLSFQCVNNIVVDQDAHKIRIPKIGWVKYFKDRKFSGRVGTVTITKSSSGKYFVSINVDDGLPYPEKPKITCETTIGIDVGIKDFAVLSDGKVYHKNESFNEDEKRLKVLQRRLSKKVKGSNRYEAQRLAIAKQYEKIKNKRVNYLHQVSTRIIRENQTIIVEDLSVQNMMKNHNLSKSIANASWSSFFKMLEYKCDYYGKNFVRIGKFEPSSKMCICGHINHDLKLSDREWVCPACGRLNDRDLLAAINIKRFGLQGQNLIGVNSPSVGGEEGVEWSALVDTVKRQYVKP